MEKLRVVEFSKDHIEQAVALDKKWFGDYGASSEDFEKNFSTKNRYALALVSAGAFYGFAVFDILEAKTEVSDYIGLITSAQTAFIQQFTTAENYRLENLEQDKVLLSAVEASARELGCTMVWEALSKDHPFAKENNPKHDAYGFYKAEGYEILTKQQISWKEMIPCNLLCKKL